MLVIRWFFQHPVLRVGQVGLIPVEGPIHTEECRSSIRIQDRSGNRKKRYDGQKLGRWGYLVPDSGREV